MAAALLGRWRVRRPERARARLVPRNRIGLQLLHGARHARGKPGGHAATDSGNRLPQRRGGGAGRVDRRTVPCAHRRERPRDGGRASETSSICATTSTRRSILRRLSAWSGSAWAQCHIPCVFNPPRPFAPTTEAAYRALAEEADDHGAAARARGFKGFYAHIHDWDHWPDPATGRRVIDVFLESSDPESVFVEPDLFWMVNTEAAIRSSSSTAGSVAPHSFTSKTVTPGRPRRPTARPPTSDLGSPTQAPVQSTSARSSNRWSVPQKEYIIERDTQVHPMLTAQIGWDFLRKLRGTPHGGSRRGGLGRRT